MGRFFQRLNGCRQSVEHSRRVSSLLFGLHTFLACASLLGFQGQFWVADLTETVQGHTWHQAVSIQVLEVLYEDVGSQDQEVLLVFVTFTHRNQGGSHNVSNLFVLKFSTLPHQLYDAKCSFFQPIHSLADQKQHFLSCHLFGGKIGVFGELLHGRLKDFTIEGSWVSSGLYKLTVSGDHIL